jgi:uncharacterized membrane protein
MNHQMNMLASIGMGAGLMYFLDPVQGRRRRVLVRDKFISALAQSGDLVDKAVRDLGHRAWGSAAEARQIFAQEHVDDTTLVARVRSTVGRAVTHPHSIEVTAHQGRVTLRGPVLIRDVARLLRIVQSVRGVHAVDNQLDVHQQADNIPDLQGEGRPRRGAVPELWQSNWTPAVRVLISAAGGSLALYGLWQRQVLGLAAGLLGVGMLGRAITNMEMRRLVGIGGGRRAVDINKTIHIQAPIEEVYTFWANVENFPRFMTHIKEVRHLGEGQSHWVAAGPAGTSVSWDAELTVYEPNRRLAWQSMPGSTIENTGIIHFDPNPDGSTRVHMRLSYNPPAGAVGHAVAWLLGRDLKTELDEDLVRLKSLLESGKTRAASGKTVQREDLQGA